MANFGYDRLDRNKHVLFSLDLWQVSFSTLDSNKFSERTQEPVPDLLRYMEMA